MEGQHLKNMILKLAEQGRKSWRMEMKLSAASAHKWCMSPDCSSLARASHMAQSNCWSQGNAITVNTYLPGTIKAEIPPTWSHSEFDLKERK